MMEIIHYLANWLAFLSDFLSDLGQVIGLSLRLSPGLADRVSAFPRATELSLAVAMLAGVSLLIGDSGVLFANRVRPLRFLAGLLLSGVLYALSLVVQAVTLWLVATFVFRTQQPISLAVLIVCLGSAPLVFGFLVMAATLGPYVGRLLRIWSWLVIVLAVRDSFHLALWQAILSTVLGRLLLELLNVPFGGSLGAVNEWLWRAVTGGDLGMDFRDWSELQTGELQRQTVLQLSNSLSERLAGSREVREQAAYTPHAPEEPGPASTADNRSLSRRNT